MVMVICNLRERSSLEMRLTNMPLNSELAFNLTEDIIRSVDRECEDACSAIYFWMHGNINEQHVKNTFQNAMKTSRIRYVLDSWLDVELFRNLKTPLISSRSLFSIIKQLPEKLVCFLQNDLRFPPILLRELLTYVEKLVFDTPSAIHLIGQEDDTLHLIQDASGVRSPHAFRSVLVCPVTRNMVTLDYEDFKVNISSKLLSYLRVLHLIEYFTYDM